MVFLNHGSFGACPRPVFEVYQGWQLKLERQPVAFLDPARGLNGWMRDARVALAGELGTHADNIVGVTSATVGLNIIARSLKLKPGDEILTTDHEYAALEKTWTFVAMRTGARIVTVKVPMPLTTERGFTEAVLKGITDRTRVGFLSHITSPTALVFPIEAVIAEARRRGIFTVIDGAHTLGHIDLDLDGLGVDFYAGNCHKWLMAPKGSAFLFVRPEIQNLIDPLVISHGWTAQSKAAGAKGAFGNSPFIDGLEMQGTRDPAAWLSVPDAIAFRRGHMWPDVARRCTELTRSTASRLAARTGLAPLSSPEFSAPQMVAMPVPRCDPLALQKGLMDNYSIEIPVFDWQGTTIVRLSVQGYNCADQCDLLLEALGTLAKL
ncbi:MAG: aminotransferase class V-fold PLP-dependent enzyme [Alphaproteobacteria bacterium]|nr:aminotransferase class V-fold PLP-dependent enzyme [Alphaproteobacteria bacterium]